MLWCKRMFWEFNNNVLPLTSKALCPPKLTKLHTNQKRKWESSSEDDGEEEQSDDDGNDETTDDEKSEESCTDEENYLKQQINEIFTEIQVTE